MLLQDEISEKGNTRTMIPMRPMTAPPAHTHIGVDVIVSAIDHIDSGIASAESIVTAKQDSHQLDTNYEVSEFDCPSEEVLVRDCNVDTFE